MLGAEIVYGVTHEQARTVADGLARRTRALFLDARASAEAADSAAALTADALGRGAAWAEAQAAAVRALADRGPV